MGCACASLIKYTQKQLHGLGMLVLCSVIPQDSEITVEKYISPEEKRKMEEAEKQEEQRRLAEMVGNSNLLVLYNTSQMQAHREGGNRGYFPGAPMRL